jgi:hypothetical protein
MPDFVFLVVGGVPVELFLSMMMMAAMPLTMMAATPLLRLFYNFDYVPSFLLS